MTTVQVDKHTYRVGRLDALKQFHVARRLAPVLAIMGVTAAALSAGVREGGLDDFLPLLGPISSIVSKMSDEDANYIIFTCLGAVERVIDDRGQPVTAGGNALMFNDIDMPAMLRLVVHVVRDNMGDFLKGLGAEAPSPSP